MFRNYPLTCLFILATICVDLALIASSSRRELLTSDSGWHFYLWNFLMPSQFSALALWSVFGKTHRLTRAAIVTLAGAALTFIHWSLLYYDAHVFHETIVMYLLQLIIIVCGALFFRLCGLGKKHMAPKLPFQFPLVEMFGWSIIVALWAFAFRAALSNFPVDEYTYIWMFASTLAPLLLAVVLYEKLSITMRLLGLCFTYLIAFIFYLVIDRLLQGEQIVLWAFGMAVTQITYISAWWAMMRMDEAMQERRAISAASREKLVLYDPHES